MEINTAAPRQAEKGHGVNEYANIKRFASPYLIYIDLAYRTRYVGYGCLIEQHGGALLTSLCK